MLDFIKKLFIRLPRKDIYVVYDDDLTDFLQSVGLYENIQNGHEKCCVCNEVVDIDRVQGIIKMKKKYRVVCDKKTCIETIKN